MKIAKDVTGLIGSTPVAQLKRVTSGCRAEVVARLESYSPGGSVKDRTLPSVIRPRRFLTGKGFSV